MIPSTDSGTLQSTSTFQQRDLLLGKCLNYLLSGESPENSLNHILSYIGETFGCERVYIFQFNEDETLDNTYEWCKEGVSKQKELLQNVPKINIGYWMDIFKNNKVVCIRDLETIRTRYPSTYSILKPQNIQSLAAAAIAYDDKIQGFLGLDNPSGPMVAMIPDILHVVGAFVATQLKYQELYNVIGGIDRLDLLTGAYNRKSMYQDQQELAGTHSQSVIYCKIKRFRNASEEDENDQIRHVFHLLQEMLNAKRIYRIGLAEFVAIYPDTEKSVVQKDIQMLRIGAAQDARGIAVGYAWTDDLSTTLNTLIIQADTMAYFDHDDHSSAPAHQELLDSFLDRYYYDLSFFLSAITKDNDNGYFYFGDIQENMFFISDNMRDRFGFDSNVVPDLINAWAGRIPGVQGKQRYWQSIRDMMSHKEETHHLRYRVTDKDGNNIWIYCYGKMKWNADNTKPLFFAGRISKQDENFAIDNVTNFPWESVLINHLNDLEKNHQSTTVIGFSFNNIGEINSIHGRSYGDKLIRSIADSLVNQMIDKCTFYRMSGMRCAALVKPECEDQIDQLVEQIRAITSEKYKEFELPIKAPCSLAVLKYPQENVNTIDFFEKLIALIRTAHHEMESGYAHELDVNMEKLQQAANMTLQLNRDVLHNMENFRAVVQPLVSTKTGRVCGGEMLMRWKFKGKDVSPGIFIPILEKEGVINLAGRWIFEQAVQACKRVLCYNPDFYLSVNVSLQQLSDEGLGDFMEETLKKHNLDGRYLVVEMTESCMDTQPDKLMSLVNSCRRCGIRIALDDFGSGYSSMRVLLQYPSSIIKLDRSLLLEMTESADKMNFITSIVYACHKFGKNVVMEGVETEVQNELVKAADCDVIQGFYYYRPTELDTLYKIAAADTSAPILR